MSTLDRRQVTGDNAALLRNFIEQQGVENVDLQTSGVTAGEVLSLAGVQIEGPEEKPPGWDDEQAAIQARAEAQRLAAEARQARQDAANERLSFARQREADRQADRLERQAAAATREAERREALARRNAPQPRTIAEAWETSTPRDLLRFAGNRATDLTDTISNAPTPGGLGPLLIACIVLVWAIVAVNPQGATRLQLMWFTFLDRTRLIGSKRGQPPSMGTGGITAPPIDDPNNPGSGGGGGGFGGESANNVPIMAEVIDFASIG